MSRTDLHKPDTKREAASPPVTDEELIAYAAKGDTIAFETLVNRYWNSALRLAQRVARFQNEAEDLVQDAFLRVHLHAHRYNTEDAPFRTWFFTILKNLCRDAIRRNPSLPFAELQESAPAIDDLESELMYKEQRASLAATIAKLPPNQQAALIMRCEGHSYAEIAAAIGVSVKAVDSLLARGKQTLHRELAGGKKKSSD